MMENRSFDHYLGWLGSDEQYLEAGKSRWGSKFRVDGKIDLTYVDGDGKRHKTHHLVRNDAEPHPFRGCGHPIPGHGWNAGRVELADGFLAAGTGNDPYAIGYYLGEDLPVHSHAARRFTVLDRSFASLLAGTFPNRQYAYTAQSDGRARRPDPAAARACTRRPPSSASSSAKQVPFADLLHRPLVALALGRRSTTPGSIPSTTTSRRARRARSRTSSPSRPRSAATSAPTTTRRATSSSGSASSARCSRRSRSRSTGSAACSSSPTTSGVASSTT